MQSLHISLEDVKISVLKKIKGLTLNAERCLKCRHCSVWGKKKGHQMRDTCNRLWCHFKALTLRKWANIIPIGESLPGSVDLAGGFWRSGHRSWDHAFAPWGRGGAARAGGSWGLGLTCHPGGRLWSPALWWSLSSLVMLGKKDGRLWTPQ